MTHFLVFTKFKDSFSVYYLNEWQLTSLIVYMRLSLIDDTHEHLMLLSALKCPPGPKPHMALTDVWPAAM